MGRDLLSSPYGRFFHLPRILAACGHRVRVALLDYRNGPRIERKHEGIHWLSIPLHRFQGEVRRQIECRRPDWIVGFSDTYFGVLAAHYASRFKLRVCIDAYDNYESYLPWCKPLHWLWRRAIDRADLVTAAGPSLLAMMLRGDTEKASAVVPMAADPTGFTAMDRTFSRRRLGLNTQGTYVGYCGSLHHSRGVDTLFSAIELVRAAAPHVEFFHSGRRWKSIHLPETISSLGYLANDDVPLMLNSMDTVVVPNRDSKFGQHSHPVKLYEAMTCGIPVVATRTLATQWILSAHPDRLVEPGNAEAMSAAVLRSVSSPPPTYSNVADWKTSCDYFEQALLENL